jgi:hypothetical protein
LPEAESFQTKESGPLVKVTPIYRRHKWIQESHLLPIKCLAKQYLLDWLKKHLQQTHASVEQYCIMWDIDGPAKTNLTMCPPKKRIVEPSPILKSPLLKKHIFNRHETFPKR